MKGWRTILANAGTIAGAVVVFLALPAHEGEAIVAGFSALANIVLRLITTGPVGQSGTAVMVTDQPKGEGR